MQTFYHVVAVQPPKDSFEFIETYNKLNFDIKELEQSVLLCHSRKNAFWTAKQDSVLACRYVEIYSGHLDSIPSSEF